MQCFEWISSLIYPTRFPYQMGFVSLSSKKSLKITKGLSKYITRRRTSNTMANRQRTEGQTNIYKHNTEH